MGLGELDKGKKKNLIVNKLMKDKDQALESAVEEDRCTEPKEDISPWRTSVFV